MKRSILASVIALSVAACSSGGGGGRYFPVGGGDLAGSGGGDGGSGGGDLAIQPDLATPLDLTVGPDFTTPPDLVTPPDLASQCRPGKYSGPLQVTVNIGFAYNVAGTVNLVVAPPLAGQSQVTGTMTATGANNGSASATVDAKQSCSTGFMSGSLLNGKATYMGFNLPFTGSLQSDWQSAAPQFYDGTLTTMGIAGMGTWSATWTGP
jgi:hypothetical protein